MDPRKTLVIADFDRVVRAAQEADDSQPSAAARSSSVVVGRVVVAGAQARSLAKTQVWRHVATLDPTLEADPTGQRERTEVQVDSAVMHHLSAEVWAGQAKHDSHLRVTAVRSSMVEIAAEVVDMCETDPAPQMANQLGAGESALTRPMRESEVTTEVLARVWREYSEIRIPRLLRMPTAKAIRITCLGLCMASAAAIAMWPPAMGKSAESVRWSSNHGAGQPVAVESTWRPSGRPAATAERSPSKRPSTSPPSAAEAIPARASEATQSRAGSVAVSGMAARAPEVTQSRAGSAAAVSHTALRPTSAVSPRGAVDALIAGKQDLALSRYRALAKSHPSDPVYAAAAEILEDAARRGDDGL